MSLFTAIKTVTIGGWILGVLLWVASSFPQLAQNDKPKPKPPATQKYNKEDYVGSETCRACHEEQFNNFAKTAHAKLERLESWKDKVHGCEACHGPGKAHSEFMSDDANVAAFKNDPSKVDPKIIVLKKLPPKEVSETCLACHAGKEEHNNFRRGEHWRNDVSCIVCHAPHSPNPGPTRPGSTTLVEETIRRNPETATIHMLRLSEPQLCLKCHTEMKAQFHMPFHHKVLEGEMNCSDCHNPHGGFETKQTRLSIGADTGCLKCHTDKQGPFVFEHAPVKVEGCTICHTPHGSSNPKLLKRAQVRQMCLECHSNAHEIGAPDTPVFHSQATIRFQNCTTCHVKIHGSNVDHFYFR